ncbi:MAG: GAF domain-containing protein [Treponemataceae bacterium]|nr:GAF domain-containing protein [Treponemataceae bacterium]
MNTIKLSNQELQDVYEDQFRMIEIGKELIREKDLDQLLRKILHISQDITGADGGSIFFVESGPEGEILRFKYSYNHSFPLQYEEFVMPRTPESIAGYVSLTGECLNIPDVYNLPPHVPFRFNNSFDLRYGYRTRSMLVVPMHSYEGTIMGVIQLINSKESEQVQDAHRILLRTPQDVETYVVPFKERYLSMMQAIANQAAIAIENARLIRQIQSQFEEFVRAAVDAVEQRDPATCGHSQRVAMMVVQLARRINQKQEEQGKSPIFSESQIKALEYAGLLHDFGKVYIEPAVFVKAKKLYPWEFEKLQLRLKYLRRSLELDFALRLQSLSSETLQQLDKEREKIVEELIEVSRQIERLNEPSLTEEDPGRIIEGILSIPLPSVRGVDGEVIPLLTEEEIQRLAICRGSLTDKERELIQQHVMYSYEFVKKIPWPPEYSQIPLIVKTHHEKLDGSGYPEGLRAEAIPFPGRLLAVADMYDALTAADRPYKKAVSPTKALEIVQTEAACGKLDLLAVQTLEEILKSVEE